MGPTCEVLRATTWTVLLLWLVVSNAFQYNAYSRKHHAASNRGKFASFASEQRGADESVWAVAVLVIAAVIPTLDAVVIRDRRV